MKDSPRDPDFCNEKFWNRRIKDEANYEMAVQKCDWKEVNPIQKEIINKYCSGRIFDAGCGYGRICEFLGDQISDYVGMDITPDFIREATRRFPDRKFLIGDIRNTGFYNNTFDWGIAIGMADCLYWPEIKKELKRVCNKVIVLWCEGDKKYEII